MTLDEAYKAWLALGQNYELDRFANTRVAFTGGFAWAGALADEVRASLPAQAGEPARLREATQTLLARYDSLDAPDPVREIADAIESLRASLAFMAGEPIRRRDTPPYRKEPAAGLIDFAAGYQVAAALPVEALAPSDEQIERLRQAFEAWTKTAPAFAPEFEQHREWAEKFAWFAVRDIALAAPPAVLVEPAGFTDAEIHSMAKRAKLPKLMFDTAGFREALGRFAVLAAAPSVPQGVTKQPAPDSEEPSHG